MIATSLRAYRDWKPGILGLAEGNSECQGSDIAPIFPNQVDGTQVVRRSPTYESDVKQIPNTWDIYQRGITVSFLELI